MLALEQTEAAGRILESLPNRIHHVFEPYIAAKPDSVAVISDSEGLTYRQFGLAVAGTAAELQELGIRAGDRVMIVSENCIALACLLFAASQLDAWAIVACPRVSLTRSGAIAARAASSSKRDAVFKR